MRSPFSRASRRSSQASSLGFQSASPSGCKSPEEKERKKTRKITTRISTQSLSKNRNARPAPARHTAPLGDPYVSVRLPFLEAVPAVDRPAPVGLEGHFALVAAFSAGSLVHFAGAAVEIAAPLVTSKLSFHSVRFSYLLSPVRTFTPGE